MHWFYYFGRSITRVMVTLFARLEVTGRENIPPEGPLLIVANHLSVADPPLLGAIIDRKMIFMAKEELFRSWFNSYFIRGYGAFPVFRDRPDRNAIRQAELCLKRGMALAMFPEGGRSGSHQLRKGLPGSALMASRCNAPILPVGISGTERIKGRMWWLRRPRLKIKIGRPFRLPQDDERTRESLERLIDLMMRRIAALLPSDYQGEYRVENEDRESQDRVLFRGHAGA